MIQELLDLNKTTDDTLVIIREFAAPQELVFDILTKKEHIPNGRFQKVWK